MKQFICRRFRVTQLATGFMRPREDRVTSQASVCNDGNVDGLPEALSIQNNCVHVFKNQTLQEPGIPSAKKFT